MATRRKLKERSKKNTRCENGKSLTDAKSVIVGNLDLQLKLYARDSHVKFENYSRSQFWCTLAASLHENYVYLVSIMKYLHIVTMALLIFNSISGSFGGITLIVDPQGEAIGMPVHILRHSPFTDFLIPGVILLACNGLSSALIAVAGIKRHPLFSLFTMIQGVASTIWIVTQVIMIRDVGTLHYIYGGIGVVLLLSGILQQKNQSFTI